METFARRELSPVYVTTGTITSEKILSLAGPYMEGAIGISRAAPWMADAPPDLQVWRQAMRTHGLAIDPASLLGWVSGRILEEALKRIAGDITPASVAWELQGLAGEEISGLVAPLGFSSSPTAPNTGANCFWPLIAREGAWVPASTGLICLPRQHAPNKHTCVSSHIVWTLDTLYSKNVPRLWSATIESHRREVNDAILETTAALVNEQGLLSVTMSQIAEKAGIGRATLYKYFHGIDAIMVAWHERQISLHLQQVIATQNQAGSAGERLAAVLETYALGSREHGGHEHAAVLHRGEHVARVRRQLSKFIQDLLAEAAQAGDVRDDVPPRELASYCLHALRAARGLNGVAEVRTLVAIILDSMRPGARQ